MESSPASEPSASPAEPAAKDSSSGLNQIEGAQSGLVRLPDPRALVLLDRDLATADDLRIGTIDVVGTSPPVIIDNV